MISYHFMCIKKGRCWECSKCINATRSVNCLSEICTSNSTDKKFEAMTITVVTSPKFNKADVNKSGGVDTQYCVRV